MSGREMWDGGVVCSRCAASEDCPISPLVGSATPSGKCPPGFLVTRPPWRQTSPCASLRATPLPPNVPLRVSSRAPPAPPPPPFLASLPASPCPPPSLPRHLCNAHPTIHPAYSY